MSKDSLANITTQWSEMEELMERLLSKIQSKANNGEIVSFSNIIHGMDRFEQVKTFIILLFLAQKNRVILWQQKEGDDEFAITTNGG